MAEKICPLRDKECTPNCAWYDQSIRARTGNHNHATCAVVITKGTMEIIMDLLLEIKLKK